MYAQVYHVLRNEMVEVELDPEIPNYRRFVDVDKPDLTRHTDDPVKNLRHLPTFDHFDATGAPVLRFQ